MVVVPGHVRLPQVMGQSHVPQYYPAQRHPHSGRRGPAQPPTEDEPNRYPQSEGPQLRSVAPPRESYRMTRLLKRRMDLDANGAGPYAAGTLSLEENNLRVVS